MKLLSLVVACVLWAGAVSAEPIIVGGKLDMTWEGTGTMALRSDRFRYDGGVSGDNGVFGPWHLTPERSQPGMTIDTSGYWVGTGARGTVHYDNRVFADVGGLESTDWLSFNFSADVVAPPITEDMTYGYLTSVDVPFGFNGRFSYVEDRISWEPKFVDLAGYGTATLWLRAYVGPNSPSMWDYAGVTYTLDAAHAPEPATLMLFASGLTVTALRLRRRRH